MDRHISGGWMHSKQRTEVSQLQTETFMYLILDTHFDITGNILYSFTPPESPPQSPASAPREMNHSATVRCSTNCSPIPDCVSQNSCGRDAANAAEDSKVGSLNGDSDLSRG